MWVNFLVAKTDMAGRSKMHALPGFLEPCTLGFLLERKRAFIGRELPLLHIF